MTYWPSEGFGNWGRWDNDLGTANLLGRQKTLEAIRSVESGDTFALGRPLAGDPTKSIQSFDYEVAKVITAADSPLVQDFNDRITVLTHSMVGTHLDALSHIGHRGFAFNGVPYDDVVDAAKGALRFGVDELPPLVGRAIFVDIPRLRGIRSMDAGDPVTPEELWAATDAATPGDILVLRTAASADHGPEGSKGRRSGLHVDCMQVVGDRDFALVATDGPGDNFPSTGGETPYPIHVLAEVYLGLPLLHNLYLEDLAEAMTERSSQHFLLTAQPLLITGGSGSPVNPVAIV